jgi:hypothetical protein
LPQGVAAIAHSYSPLQHPTAGSHPHRHIFDLQHTLDPNIALPVAFITRPTQGVGAVARGCSKLQHLNLKYTPVRDGALQAAARCLVALTCLNVTHCQNITDTGVLLSPTPLHLACHIMHVIASTLLECFELRNVVLRAGSARKRSVKILSDLKHLGL